MKEMAPVNNHMRAKNKFIAKGGNSNAANKRQGGDNKPKRKWVPEHKMFDGSVGEGQGFAFKRKQKVQHEYNKLLRKERRKNTDVKTQYKEEYPEHLKHLYLAEAEKLRTEARMNRIKRTKSRLGGVVEEVAEDLAEEASTDHMPHSDPGVSEDQIDLATQPPEPTEASEADSVTMSNRQKKKMMKKTSYQKTKEEFEKMKEKRSKKKEEFIKNKKQKEEAVQKYKQKKVETFQMLSKKTKKGQPNLNLQMEYLLQKIQCSGK